MHLPDSHLLATSNRLVRSCPEFSRDKKYICTLKVDQMLVLISLKVGPKYGLSENFCLVRTDFLL